MNPVVKWLVRGKLSSFLRAERFTGYRTYLCMSLFLVALGLQVIGLQLGWPPDMIDTLEVAKQAAVAAGGLALAAKVERKANGKKPAPKRKKRPTDRVRGGRK